MSQYLIQKYLNELATLKRVSGSHRESVVREAFKDLLKAWGRSQNLDFVPEYAIQTKAKDRRYVDGALLHTLRVPFGYWEAKDSDDDLDEDESDEDSERDVSEERPVAPKVSEQKLVEEKYFSRRSVREIADEAHTTEKAVESKLSRVRRKLKDAVLAELIDESRS